MGKKIFMPNVEQSRRLLENAWQDFCRQAEEAGLKVDDTVMDGLLKDFFVAGYAFGHNDTLNIIRDQMEVDDMISNLMAN